MLNPLIFRHRKNAKEYRALKEHARALVHERIAHFNLQYGFPYRKVAIRNQKTRWGSCSKAGNLNFNYKISLLPQELSDYIIVHELCHLKEFNHSKKFWNLVTITIPDFKNRRAQLRGRKLKQQAPPQEGGA